MTKDFYEDALKLFTRKEDQDELKAWHHVDHDLLVVDQTYIFLAKESDEVIDASELMKRTLNVAAKNWNSAVEENKNEGFSVMSYIRQTWHDEQYYNWRSVERYLSDMLLDHIYFDVAPELQTAYYRINTTTLKKELRNDHKKQVKAYVNYLKERNVHGYDSMQEYLENNKAVAAFGYIKFGHDVYESVGTVNA
ncbi:hypothetical protein [Lactobacillus kitasatonis]|uniref:hypothetical protein n=1 Tax=Lactobacillus kitasatonis TaxID=237446 RepID=UPI003F66BDF6